MNKILVMGIGSRIMMDDGIGIYLVEDLKKHIVSPHIEFIIGESDFDYCNSKLSKGDFIIVIDAYLSGKDTGDIVITPIGNLNKFGDDHYSMHGMHFLQSELDGILIGIEPHEINYGFSLSDKLQELYETILGQVKKEVELMHDTFLLKRISESLNELCSKNRIIRVRKMRIITNNNQQFSLCIYNINNLPTWQHKSSKHVAFSHL